MRRSAIDALQRGLLNLRANPALLLLQLGQGLALGIFTVLGLIPIFLALGTGAVRAFWEAGQRWSPGGEMELERLIEGSLEQWPLLLAAVAAAGAIWTVGFLVFCWFQAGVLGLLAAGEERAQDAGVRPPVESFRVFSWDAFTRQAGARVWKYFWLFNLYLVLATVVIGVFLTVFSVGVALLAREANPFGAVALGCLLIVAVLGVVAVFFVWIQVGKTELAVGDDGVRAAFRRSLSTLSTRPGGVLLLVLLFFVASVALSVIFLPLSLATDFAMGDSFTRQLTADLVMGVFQSGIGALVSLALSASLIALVRGER